jgi:predicted Rossmann-fold nucleotide-binding protein
MGGPVVEGGGEVVGSEDVPMPSGGLYRVDELLGGWRADDRLSYAASLDARVFRAAVGAGLRTPRAPETARERALHDHAITLALNALVKDRRVVAFMGGYRLGRDSSAYALVAEIARRLSALGYLVVSGGGPGAMEAAHLGARLATAEPGDLAAALALLSQAPEMPAFAPGELVHDGRFDEQVLAALHAWQAPAFAVAERWSGAAAGESVGIPTWLYGHEPPTPLATLHAKYFESSLREDGLLAIAKAGVVYAEGSAGTLQEVFQDAAQNFYASVDGTRSPMVFLDLDECWTVRRPVRLLLEGLFDEEAEKLLHFVTTADDAVAAIEAGAGQQTPDLVRGQD